MSHLRSKSGVFQITQLCTMNNISHIVNGSEPFIPLAIFVAEILVCHAHGKLIPFAGLRERQKMGVFFF
jgi:hypothetical protein